MAALISPWLQLFGVAALFLGGIGLLNAIFGMNMAVRPMPIPSDLVTGVTALLCGFACVNLGSRMSPDREQD
jgi:hypothetical protein